MDIFAFIQKNLFLVAAAAVSGGMLVWPLINRAMAGGKDVSALEAVQMINRRDALVLDVREPAEFAAGHIPNARHVPVATLKDRLQDLEKFKQRPVVVACASGSRAISACSLLRKSGFQEVFPLKGGMSGWQQAGLPVERKK